MQRWKFRVPIARMRNISIMNDANLSSDEFGRRRRRTSVRSFDLNAPKHRSSRFSGIAGTPSDEKRWKPGQDENPRATRVHRTMERDSSRGGSIVRPRGRDCGRVTSPNKSKINFSGFTSAPGLWPLFIGGKRRVPSLAGATGNDFSSLIVTVDALSPRGKTEILITIDACAQRTEKKRTSWKNEKKKKRRKKNGPRESNFAKSLAFEVSWQVTNKRFCLLSWRSAIVQIGKTARQSVKADLLSHCLFAVAIVCETVFTISCNVRPGEVRNPITAVTDDVTILQRIVIVDSISVSERMLRWLSFVPCSLISSIRFYLKFSL